ncbi:hypothetical protein REPUB_Repub04eG0009100 [Reevesia pubescens]
MEQIWNMVKPPLLMVLVQVIMAGSNLMYKLASNDGMNLRILIAYRFIFATAIMLPTALVFERKSLIKINGTVIFLAFFCGLFGGALGQNLYVQSLVFTSATFVAAMLNLVPGISYILSIFLRMEKLAIGTTAGKAKLLGTAIGIGGAMVFTFYKGVNIDILSTNVNLLRHGHQQAGGPAGHGTGKFILGAALGLLSCISMAVWLIFQAKMSVRFPYHHSATALMCMMGSIQGTVFVLCTEKDWDQWKLGWNVRLLAVAFTGILGAALMVFLISCVVHLKGPLYSSSFNPLGLCFVAIQGSLLLDEKLHLGSIIGGLLIVCGLYMVLWGKAKEKEESLSVSTPGTTTTTANTKSQTTDKQRAFCLDV